jgi:hypothetical protein
VRNGEVSECSIRLEKLATVRILSIPADASLFINGRPVGKSPWAQEYVAGTRLAIRITKDEHVDWTEEVVLSGDTTISAKLALAGGTLSITTTPAGAKVYLDGQGIGISPVRQEQVAAGEHVLHIEAHGYVPIEDKVAVEMGRVAERDYTLTRLCLLEIESTRPALNSLSTVRSQVRHRSAFRHRRERNSSWS